MSKRKAERHHVTVGDFYERHRKELQLQLAGEPAGLERRIWEPTINRPGLALAGFYTYFANKRVQVIGSAELTYLKSLTARTMRSRFQSLCEQRIPCVVFSRRAIVPDALLEEAARHGIAIFRTPLITMKFINAATIALENEFAPTCSMHGSMVDIMGIGTLVSGASGIGKSECVLGLIERGYSLVSDDVTYFRAGEGRELVGTSPELTRGHIEVRGLGIIDVPAIFGVGAIRLEKRLDLIVTLKDWQELEEVDRIGLEQEFEDVLGVEIPHITIPVRVGRDIARLVEVAAQDQKLKALGWHSAIQFNQKLLRELQSQKKS